jgi:predicted solute-binding protein
MRHRLTYREQAHFEPEDKKSQAKDNKQYANQQIDDVVRRLLQHEDLKKRDNQNYWSKVTQAFRHGTKKPEEIRFQNILLRQLDMRED